MSLLSLSDSFSFAFTESDFEKTSISFVFCSDIAYFRLKTTFDDDDKIDESPNFSVIKTNIFLKIKNERRMLNEKTVDRISLKFP